MAIFYFPIFLLGLAVGSFLNSVIYRLQTGESFLFQRSYCPHCKHSLNWQDLIPLLSFFILRRRCRYCQGKISWQYPLVELITGALFVFIALQWLNDPMATWLNFPYLLFVSSILIIIFVYDLKHFIIPDKVIYPAIILAVIYNLYQFTINNQQLAISNFLAAFDAAAFFLAIVLISKGRWMGLGDPKLAFFMGLLLGFPNIFVALFFAFFIGAIIGIGLIIFGKKELKSEVPFGPFLVTGTFIALFFGEKIIDWYFNLFW